MKHPVCSVSCFLYLVECVFAKILEVKMIEKEKSYQRNSWKTNLYSWKVFQTWTAPSFVLPLTDAGLPGLSRHLHSRALPFIPISAVSTGYLSNSSPLVPISAQIPKPVLWWCVVLTWGQPIWDTCTLMHRSSHFVQRCASFCSSIYPFFL